MKIISKNLEETSFLAKDFVQNLSPKEDGAFVVGLYGELGSGKTTFMKYVAESLGLQNDIQSPTFVIEKIYKLPDLDSNQNNNIFKHLIHIDAYRIEDPKEMLVLGWQDILRNSDNVIFVEWPEKIQTIMEEHTKIKFSHISETEREIEIEN